ncbi:MAG: alpha/beta hydrolase family protein, partial [Noviherbaspirillum sp.]
THDDTIDIGVDDEHIAGTIVTPSTQVPGVLFVHGWGGSQEQYLARARKIAALGSVCLTFDLRGHARTQPQHETVSRENNLRDVLAAYDLLASQRHVDPTSIAVVGSSYGGYLAAILTSLRVVKWLVLRAPALYMDSSWELPKRQLHRDQDLITYRESLVPAAENLALRACAAFHGDVLVIESERDHLLPHAVISSYLEACIQPRSLTYRVLHGADHGLTDDNSQRAYTSVLVNWLKEMVVDAEEDKDAPASVTASGPSFPEVSPRRA